MNMADKNNQFVMSVEFSTVYGSMKYSEIKPSKKIIKALIIENNIIVLYFSFDMLVF